MEGTVESGVRSENVESVLESPRRRVRGNCGGDEEITPVEDVGIGVGYSCFSLYFDGETRATRFAGRGSDGEEENGSNAGSNDGAGRLTPATGETTSAGFLPAEKESIVPNIKPT